MNAVTWRRHVPPGVRHPWDHLSLLTRLCGRRGSDPAVER